jgi:hypothetical protein
MPPYALFQEAVTRGKGEQPGNQNAAKDEGETNGDNITVRSPEACPR